MSIGRTVRVCTLTIAFLLASHRTGAALQRNGTMPPVQAPTPDYSAGKPSPNSLGGMPDLGDPTTRHEMEQRRGNMLNIERQRAMVREAGQLVQLAAELQASLAGDPQGAAREEALHRIDTIEKLARNVKERMKGGR